jgi:hypothetical protein
MKSFLLQTTIAIGLLACTGCTAISFSAIGSIADLGNSAVTVGRDKYYFGKLTTAEMTDLPTARRAALAAARDLGLYLKAPETIDDGTLEFAFLDEDGTQIGVALTRRSGSLTRIKCDVGIFGSEVTDRLFLLRMRAHLPAPNAPAPRPPADAANRDDESLNFGNRVSSSKC